MTASIYIEVPKCACYCGNLAIRSCRGQVTTTLRMLFGHLECDCAQASNRFERRSIEQQLYALLGYILDCLSKYLSMDDFCGITISPVISKVFESCILDRYISSIL